MVDLGIVIVNWNTADELETCLKTVFASTGDFTYHVVVVDNGSTDRSVSMVREQFPQVELIETGENLGFPKGNNVGLRHLGYHDLGDVTSDAPRYALLLNPDTEVPEESLYQMVQFMDSRPDVGVAGPKLLLPDGSLDRACRRGFPTPLVSFYHFSGLAKLFPKNEQFGRYNMTFADPNDELEVDSVVGAYLQIRKEVIEKIGLLDEVYFMYAEDIDWCYRAKSVGYKVWYYAPVTVYHIKRAASRKNAKAQFEFWRAMLIFYRKYYRDTTPFPVHTIILLALLFKGGPDLWQEIRQPSVSPMSL
ncbi:MAG: glycosyltransferase family 2 protein [Chloroflexota bacterium]